MGNRRRDGRHFGNSFSPVRARLEGADRREEAARAEEDSLPGGVGPQPRTTVSMGRSSGSRLMTIPGGLPASRGQETGDRSQQERNESRSLPDSCLLLPDSWSAVASVARYLAEYSSGPAPDSHRLPPQLPQPVLAVKTRRVLVIMGSRLWSAS